MLGIKPRTSFKPQSYIPTGWIGLDRACRLDRDVDYHPPQQEPISSEEESSGDEDPIPQSSRGHRSTATIRTPRHGPNDDTEDSTPGPSFQEQPKEGQGVRWRAAQLTPNLAHFEPEEETEQDREGWTPIDYVSQYIDKDLIKLIVYCSNATALSGMYHFFGASILMSCVSYPQIRMYWSSAIRFPAIADKFTRDRFHKLRQSIKLVIDDDIPEDLRECDKFWKASPESVSIDEQMIPFTGACPLEGLMLDFELYQGADALTAQVQEPGELGLGGLVIDRLSETLHPSTKVYCNRFFTSIKTVNRMMEKKVYLTGTGMKNRVFEAVEKLPIDKKMKKNGRGISAQVTTEDGNICIVKWYDNKPVLMMSVVHDAQAEDTCQRWDKKKKQYVSVRRPIIVCEYNNKMGGVDLIDRMISYYRLSVRTKKWTHRMLMHFTDVALANSWLLYRRDHTERGTPRNGIMQFLEFRMEVAKTFLAQHNNSQEDSTDLSEQEDNTDHSEPKKKRFVKEVPHISVRRRANAHLPQVVNLKNAARCRAKGCSGKTRVRCATCKVFLCLQTARNCYTVFHSKHDQLFPQTKKNILSLE
ncbi:putative piggyBac transposable element-derived protein 3-like [Triplophysa rosa]|uniref:PiggyBac transposable element-derived protein 3-like n=1 Tax=Triplophysa rosa TaxID=992332 RepID=A0A9W7W8B9_TRIRA|nr:putative piggyBac transposable element-derived protein 3-like [Triplophysa rosa]